MLAKLLKSYFITKFRTFASRRSLEDWQNRQVIKHLEKVKQKSSFYKHINPSNWKEIPIITKKEMMQNFDTLNTCNIKREEAFSIALKAEQTRDFAPMIGDITIGLSSGTSGNRGLFLANPHERFTWAGALLAKVLPNSILKKQKICLFLRANSNLYSSLKSNRIQFEYFDLLKPIEEHISRLNKLQPDVIAAPPSVLRMLAQTELRISPKKIISIAEVLDPLDKKIIENHFGQIVHQIYQATEGFLATTCAHGTLHLNEDLLVIQKEYIDKDRFYPIITDFNRLTQPIIRYKLNDILQEQTCTCGSVFTALKCIEGRSDDIFYLRSKSKLIPIFPDFIRRAIITSNPHIEEYLAIQHSPDSIEIVLSSHREEVSRALTHFFKEMNVDLPNIFFTSNFAKAPDKKLRRIERRFSDPTL